MIDPTKVAIRSTTQDHLDIEDIRDNLVLLKDGGACLILTTTAINFDLLSEREQEAMIYAYAGLLNSLNFPIQIVLRSQRKDISAYLRLLEEAELKAVKPEIKAQIQKYRKFITETVQKNQVLDKKFFIIIPMSTLELGISQTLSRGVKKNKKLPYDKEYILNKAKINLIPKKDHVVRLLAHLGLAGKQLETQELIQLFFNLYNPENIGQAINDTQQYETPMVQISMRTAEPPPKMAPILPKTEVTPPASEVPAAPTVPVAAPANLPPILNNKPTTTPDKPETTIYHQINSMVEEAAKQG